MLTQEEAEKILITPKIIVERGKKVSSYVLDFMESNDFRICLSPSDSIDNATEYLLRIRVSNKMRAKISLHTQDNDTHFCVFRLDFNGPPHSNPYALSEDVPEKFKPFAGKKIEGNHVHYHVYGYPSAAWALPIENDSFPVKALTEENFSGELRDILQSLSEVIHLESTITLTSRMMLNGMD